MPTTKKRPRRYPWSKWFSQHTFRLKRGRDYDCMPHSMAQQIRNKAIELDFYVSVHIGDGGTILVTARPKYPD